MTAAPISPAEHDHSRLAALITEITDLPAIVGSSTGPAGAPIPVRSGGVRFQVRDDGRLESMSTDCSACGRIIEHPYPGACKTSLRATFGRLRHLTIARQPNRLMRAFNRFTSCPICLR